MDKKILIILLAIPVLSVTLTWLTLENSTDTRPDIDLPAMDSKHRVADQFLNDAVIINFDRYGIPKSQISGSQLLHYPGEEDAELLDPHIVLHREKGSPVEITADKGWVNQDGTRVIFKGHTVVERKKSNDNNYSRLDTPLLIIWPKREFAETEADVKITTATTVTTGTGMKAYLDRERYYLLNNVRVHHETKGQDTH